jgi:hypothetical protein
MPDSEKPLIDQKLLLEKFQGKGGWTYAQIPGIAPDKKNYFGWRKVRGFIDAVEIRKYHLMPMGNGQLFLPIKASIRKKIKKEEGDWINVVLYEDNEPEEIPEEFELCLKDASGAWENFISFKEQEQRKYIQWIYRAKTEDQKIERMAEAINKIEKNELL